MAMSTSRDVAPTALKEKGSRELLICCVTCTQSPEEQHVIFLLAEHSNARLGEARDSPCSPAAAQGHPVTALPVRKEQRITAGTRSTLQLSTGVISPPAVQGLVKLKVVNLKNN